MVWSANVHQSICMILVDKGVGEQHEQGDDEAAHGMTDDLHRDVLAAIAAGAPDAQILAAAALRTETLGFSRWCA